MAAVALAILFGFSSKAEASQKYEVELNKSTFTYDAVKAWYPTVKSVKLDGKKLAKSEYTVWYPYSDINGEEIWLDKYYKNGYTIGYTYWRGKTL